MGAAGIQTADAGGLGEAVGAQQGQHIVHRVRRAGRQQAAGGLRIGQQIPGFGGQAFIPSALDKLRAVRAMIDKLGKPIRLEIDGGVKTDNIAQIAAAGADTFVAGSAIFGQPGAEDARYVDVVRRMKDAVAAVR